MVGGELSDILIVNVITIGFILASLGLQDKEERTNRVVLGIALLGQASYSIYIWHQVIYAFYKYGVESQVEGVDYLFITLLVVVVSSLSYRFLEREMGKFRKRSAKMVLGVATLLSVGVIGLSLWLYTHAGVVRDIPELGVERNNAHRGMFAEYCDRVYRMQTPFADNGKPKLLIIGNSYGRDMMNVILESSYKDSLDLSYIYPPKQLRDSEISRIQQADVICVLASYRFKEGYADLMQGIYEYTTTNHIYGIGTKEFGETNGNEYQKRHSEEYFTLTAPMDSDYVQEYKMERNCWPEAYYIDFVKPVHMANYRVRIFTDNQKFISQDCRHLTQEGARFYARELDLAKLVQFK